MALQVTPRYMATAWQKVVETRCDEWWWDYCIKQVNDGVARAAETATAAAASLATARARTSQQVTVDLTDDADGAEAVTTTTTLPMSPGDRAATKAAMAAAVAAEAAAAAAAERARRAALESAELKRRVEPKANMPTSLAAMKKHPTYCIKAQLGKYEMVRPDAKACPKYPLFKGHAVYYRRDVAVLHTADKWKRHLRQVRAVV